VARVVSQIVDCYANNSVNYLANQGVRAARRALGVSQRVPRSLSRVQVVMVAMEMALPDLSVMVIVIVLHLEVSNGGSCCVDMCWFYLQAPRS